MRRYRNPLHLLGNGLRAERSRLWVADGEYARNRTIAGIRKRSLAVVRRGRNASAVNEGDSAATMRCVSRFPAFVNRGSLENSDIDRAMAMKSGISVLLVLASLVLWTGVAQPGASNAPPEAASKPAMSEQLQREAKLAALLSGAVLRGNFQMTNAEGLEGKAPMTKPIVERYEIASATKLAGDMWSIMARIQYADRDVNVPVTVRIKWAAGTPVITLDKMQIPLIGQYSARVIIDDGFYAGTWRGHAYGGVLSGQILKKDDVERIEKMEAGGWNMRMPGSAPKAGDTPAEESKGE